jgi:hypothetical protein
MGARVNFVFKQDESGKNLTLYSHWGADTWEIDLAYALDKARSRWDDPSYGSRIVVSQLIGDQWQSETGFGLYVTEDTSDFWDEVVIVDFVNKTVNGVPFETYITYGQAKGEYQDA